MDGTKCDFCDEPAVAVTFEPGGRVHAVPSLAYLPAPVALPEAQCEPEEAERRGDAMPCEEHSRVDATRLTTM